MSTLQELMTEFYVNALGLDPDQSYSFTDLQYAFFLGIHTGDITIGGGTPTDVSGLAPKNMTAGYRLRTGGAQDGPWEARPVGYKVVIAVGVDPDPDDHGDFDLRYIPGTP
jgi:hypothetical protein